MSSFVRSIIHSPIFDDEDKTRKAALIYMVSGAILFLTVLLSVITVVIRPHDTALYLLKFAFILTFSGINIVLVRRGQVHRASQVFLVGLWLMVTASILNSGSLKRSLFTGYFLIVMLAWVLLGKRTAISFLITSILASILIVLLNLYLPEQSGLSVVFMLFSYSIVAVLLLLIINLGQSNLESALRRAQRSESALLERNRQLEQEISTRIKAEKALHRSEYLYRTLARNFPNGAVVLFDHDLRYLLAAGESLADVNLSEKDMEGKTFREVFPEEMADAVEQEYRAALRGETKITEITFQGQTFLTYTLPVEDDTSEIIAGMSMSQNITERKQLEQQHLENSIAREKAAFLTEFMTNIGHDLRTPLSAIGTSIYLLERHTDPDKRQEKLEAIKKQVLLMEKYIDDMSIIMRLEYTPETFREDIDLNALFEAILSELRPSIDEKQLHVALELAAEPPTVYGNHDELYRAIYNLVENAVNYTADAGTLTIRTSLVDQQLFVEIQDTGIGIRPEDLPFIFERFYRADKARSIESGGTGLGLAITKRVVERHGGTVAAESILGEGSTFAIKLPTSSTRH